MGLLPCLTWKSAESSGTVDVSVQCIKVVICSTYCLMQSTKCEIILQQLSMFSAIFYFYLLIGTQVGFFNDLDKGSMKQLNNTVIYFLERNSVLV